MPVPKLLLPPTLLAASAVTYAATETVFLRSLLAAPPDVAGNALFQWLWRGLLPGGIGLAALTSGGGAATGAWAWTHLAKGTPARWYVGWGSLAAGMHFVWGPAVAVLIERMVNHPSDSRADVRRWLRIHYVRTVTSNIAALGCFLAAWFA